MCHHCGADLAKSKEDKKIPENENSLELNTQEPIGSCTLCRLKKMEESINQGGGTSYSTPMFSPVAPLSSCDSSVSSSSEYSVDVNSYDRYSQGEKKINSRPEDVSYMSNGDHNNSSFDSKGNGLDRSDRHTEGNLRENHNSNEKDIVKDVEIMQSNGPEANDNSGATSTGSFGESTENSQPLKDEKNIPIWEPPEPEDPEDDMEGSVAFNDDDDDECGGDGTKWGKPSSLSPYRDEESGSYRFKEDKQRAMEEVINGKFKVFVSQLLKSIGVTFSGDDSDSWVDIVTYLSWEAAAFLKPNAIVGNTMDPNGYVKVKCIATGTRSQSQVVKGLVFKKHAAHKHMPTKHKNPRLLLVQGVLGQSSSGLSSFNSMEQEKDKLKSVIEMLELCHPKVVFVEKTVSRDIQESILKKGMTLVFDMKLHRLERIARCTGSPILSSDTLTSQKLKQCDSFHFEKFVEEHASLIEGGKKPTKTLMFVEGCTTHQGCTILLKGAHSDELKKIKCVVQCAVVMAYHLIVETSFLVDQRAMFSTIPFTGMASALFSEVDNMLPTNSRVPSFDEEAIGETESDSVDIPISNGFHDGVSQNFKQDIEGISPLYEPYNPAILTGLSSLSASLKKVIGENFPLASSSYQSLSSYLGFNRGEPNGDVTKSSSGSASPKAGNHYDIEEKISSDELKSVNGDQVRSSLECSEAFQELQKDDRNAEEEMQNKDDINTLLDSQSILVLMSKRNALRGTVCEQSHFSHIMFYKNFDVPLGNFLRDNLLNQRRQCKTCVELPEAHLYYYAHHNKQLTIQVSRLPEDKHLHGEADGKLWMWCRCGKCKAANETFKGSKRRLISSAARGLSFGKFLELSFSLHSSSSKISSCGHSLHRDFLYFFGLGRMVAMFSYSPIETYTLSVPPQKISFSSSIRQEWLKEQTYNVYARGILLFIEVANSLKKVKSQFEGLTLNIQNSIKAFSDIEEMLEQEKKEFEMKIQEAFERSAKPGQADYLLLRLNRLLWELLLESCIWDRRMESLLSPEHWVGDSGVNEKEVLEVMTNKMDRANGDEIINKENAFDDDIETNDGASQRVIPDTYVEKTELPIKEIPVKGSLEECKAVDPSNVSNTSSREDLTQKKLSSLEASIASDGLNHYNSYDGRADNFPLSDHQGDRTAPIFTKHGKCDPVSHSNLSKNSTQHLHISNLENSSEWFWAPFGEISEMDIKILRREYLPKFECIGKFTPNNLPTAHQLITEEGQRLHIPTGTDNYIVSDYDDELSSIIACALALLKDLPVHAEGLDNDGRANGAITKMIESLHSLTRVPTITSPHWSPNGSFDFDSVHSTSSISLEESRFSSFDGLSLLDSLVPPGTLNPIVPLGASSSLPKGRYTVVCPYANHFRDLRNRCCPSELDYIASLSRCRNWDAKGGKSKSFFAKTLDDRLIIKEIKKTEFESFMKFAEDYFNYVKQSFELGNQTCLTKVLGIYQVIVRQSKSGKETRHDLMVMENLTFGRNITRQYDLKGALHDRCILTDGSGVVLLDQNFVNDMNSSPLYVSNKSKRILQRAIFNDTKFLEKINVMDYSLLVGVDSQNRELVCGIIDYLRQYTWDKQLETWVKSSLVPKNLLPTVISPIEYKTRFRKFMSTHFLSVPDHWCSEKTTEDCKLCGVGDDNFTEIPAEMG